MSGSAQYSTPLERRRMKTQLLGIDRVLTVWFHPRERETGPKKPQNGEDEAARIPLASLYY
jgi:hypothetical protein